MTDRRLRWLDLLWLAALMFYALAGTSAATFHGDEAMQIYMSSDYFTVVEGGSPQQLTVQPPYFIDSDPQLRILNGSVNRYLIGLTWQAAGGTRETLPPRPGWDWGLSYIDNVATDHRPAQPMLVAARLSSSLFFAFSIPLMFTLGRLIGGRVPAYLASAVYGLHPVLLLNGRRAMQEGSLLFFGLLAIVTAVVIVRRRADRGAPPSPLIDGLLWIGLALSCALTLASKHSGVVFVAAALGWVWLADLVRFSLGRLLRVTALTVVCGLAALGIFVALSPALWNDPPTRFSDLLAVRAELLDIQVGTVPDGAMDLGMRAEWIVLQPFIAPPMYYEVTAWNDVQPVIEEIAAYEASGWAGLPFGWTLGLALTLLAVAGIVTLIVSAIRPQHPAGRGLALGVFVWLLITSASLMANPLPWQRYYLPLMPIAALLAGIGARGLARIVKTFRHNPNAGRLRSAA